MTRMKLAALAAALALPLAAVAQEAPGTFKIPGTSTTMRFYGYVQTDATLDFSGRVPDIENYDWATIVFAQPLDASGPAAEHTGDLYFTARTTRVGFTTSTPTDAGVIGTKIEADFNGSNAIQGQSYTNSVLFRLRHAYGTIGPLLVGQTWSNFLDLPSYPDTVDFNGPGTIALVRQPQVRYTFALPSNWNLAIAAENPHNFQTGRWLPDLTAMASTSASWGTLSFHGVTMQYRPATGGPQSGFGLAASGTYKLGGDTIVALLVGGQGLGRYMFNDGNNATGFDANGNFRLWKSLAYHIGYTHVWNSAYRSNLVWSQTFFGENDIVPVTAPGPDGVGANNKIIYQAFANTFWTFAKNAEFGIEYVYGLRHTYATVNANGRENRINASLHYNIY